MLLSAPNTVPPILCYSALPPCPCLSVKLSSFKLLFSLHDFVFDTVANFKRAPQIGELKVFGSGLGGGIDRVHRLVLHKNA